ncbi:MAG TPA: multiheme c-type cytochrome [Blastocatellia bacterium]|nr:multiheme c-type cytochrome [Blastocatellia bacterium]
MTKRFIQFSFFALFLVGLVIFVRSAGAQGNPTPAPLGRPDYNYSESNGCPSCHFSRGAGGDHMPEAVGVIYDETAKAFKFTGGGWRASVHATTNYKSTQNTYCAKCHSPIQAKAEAGFKNGVLKNAEQIEDGKVEGVTCAACHPSHNAAVILGRRLGIYQFGVDKTKPEAYKVVEHGEEDQLCLNCHVSRHNEDNAAFKAMYDAGVKCMDCHMAPYGFIVGTEVEKRFHDFKVAKNLPYSCGVDGSMVSCHPGYSAQGTLGFLPLLKQQHLDWWPMKNKPGGGESKAPTAADYRALWQGFQARSEE